MREVIVTKEPVELYKILKFEGMASSVGEAKAVISEGQVRVNGLMEIQKRKKIVSGDTIEFGTEKVRVVSPPAKMPSNLSIWGFSSSTLLPTLCPRGARLL